MALIMNIGLTNKRVLIAGYSACTVGKAGVSMMSDTLAQEAAQYGVRVLCIPPGAIRTPLNGAVWQDTIAYQDLLTKIPMGEIEEPEDIAHMAIVSVGCRQLHHRDAPFHRRRDDRFPSFSHGG